MSTEYAIIESRSGRVQQVDCSQKIEGIERLTPALALSKLAETDTKFARCLLPFVSRN
jgi:hypothetical protein